MRTRPTNGVNNVLGIRTANESCWMCVDLPIPELTYLIIGCVLGEDEMASEECREILKSGYRVFFLSRFFMFKAGISSLKSSADRVWGHCPAEVPHPLSSEYKEEAS
jgi:hypothetical protein